MPLEDAIKFFGKTLAALKVPYAIIGGVATGALGQPRATRDVDIVLLLKPEDSPAFLDALEKSGMEIDKRRVVEQRLSAGKPVKLRWTRKVTVDLRLAGYAIDRSAIKRAMPLTIDRQRLFLAPAEELIVYKLVRFDALDERDILGVIRMQQDTLDWRKIADLANELARELQQTAIIDNLTEIRRRMKLERS